MLWSVRRSNSGCLLSPSIRVSECLYDSSQEDSHQSFSEKINVSVSTWDGNHFCASLLLLKGATKPQTTQEENAASLWQRVGTKGPHPHQSGQCLEPQLGSELMITLGYFKHQTNQPAWLPVQEDALSSLPACWCTFLQQGRGRGAAAAEQPWANTRMMSAKCYVFSSPLSIS